MRLRMLSDHSAIREVMDFELLRNRVTLIQRRNTSVRYSRRIPSIGSFMSMVNRCCFCGNNQTKELGSMRLGTLGTLILSQLTMFLVLICGPTPTSTISWHSMMLFGTAIMLVLTFCIALSLVNMSFASITHV